MGDWWGDRWSSLCVLAGHGCGALHSFPPKDSLCPGGLAFPLCSALLPNSERNRCVVAIAAQIHLICSLLRQRVRRVQAVVAWGEGA